MPDIRSQVESFIAYKQGVGIQMTSSASALRQFARYAEEASHTGPINVDIAVAWATHGFAHNKGYEIRRYEMARHAAEYASVFDDSLPRLPVGLLGKFDNRIQPYIFTEEDMALLMLGARCHQHSDPMFTLSNEFYLGLLFATGMRPSEPLTLCDSDFNAGAPTLLIRNSKSKDRIIPVSESTASQIARYMERRDALLRRRRTDRMILASRQGEPLNLPSAQSAFNGYKHILLGRGEIWRRRPPRLYDARHTFTCRTILRWHEGGENINACLPLLATYLGHATITETYWYLTGTPELMEIACASFGEMVLGEVSSDEIE